MLRLYAIGNRSQQVARLHTRSMDRSCMRCQNWVYVNSFSLSIRHMVSGRSSALASTGIMLGSGALETFGSIFGPFLSFTASTCNYQSAMVGKQLYSTCMRCKNGACLGACLCWACKLFSTQSVHHNCSTLTGDQSPTTMLLSQHSHKHRRGNCSL